MKITLSQMKLMKEEDLKVIVKKACETKALEYLNKKKESHSKVLHLAHNSWGQQPYLKPNQMTAKDAKFIFLLRTRMLDVRINFRNSITISSVQIVNQLMMIRNIFSPVAS